jgi:hypothetical protein
MICGTFCSVYVIGMYEAYIQVVDEAAYGDTLAFMLRYAWDQLFISAIWDTKPPELSALACGLEPADILREFEENADDAKVQLFRLQMETWRCLIAGYLCLGQLLTIINISMEAPKDKA